MHDSLNPLAGLTPLTGMWLNCIFGGVGVGLINFLIYLIVGVFLAGLMVGRTPEYLGKKVEAREMKLAMLALLIHPLMILGADRPVRRHRLGHQVARTTPAPTASPRSSTSSPRPPPTTAPASRAWRTPTASTTTTTRRRGPYAPHWDIACGLVMLLSRFIPIIAPLALAGSLAAKKPTPFTAGTLRTDTITFGFVLLGTILLVGALLFLPAAVLGPVAEHLGPMPFGG